MDREKERKKRGRETKKKRGVGKCRRDGEMFGERRGGKGGRKVNRKRRRRRRGEKMERGRKECILGKKKGMMKEEGEVGMEGER